jgi:hypothetical protein
MTQYPAVYMITPAYRRSADFKQAAAATWLFHNSDQLLYK